MSSENQKSRPELIRDISLQVDMLESYMEHDQLKSYKSLYTEFSIKLSDFRGENMRFNNMSDDEKINFILELRSFLEEMIETNKLMKEIIGFNESTLKDVFKSILKEISYNKFKTETKFRTKSEQLHKAVREIKKRSMEMDKLVEYTTRLKNELSEADNGMKYWKATHNALGKISETISQVNNKIKNLIQ